MSWASLRMADRLAHQRRDDLAAKAHGRAVKRHETRQKLIAQLRSRGRGCPDCTGAMLERRRKRDGKPFLGCSSYPACRHTEEVRRESPQEGPRPHGSEHRSAAIHPRSRRMKSAGIGSREA